MKKKPAVRLVSPRVDSVHGRHCSCQLCARHKLNTPQPKTPRQYF